MGHIVVYERDYEEVTPIVIGQQPVVHLAGIFFVLTNSSQQRTIAMT